MEDIKMKMFFDIHRWEEMIDKAYDKRIDRTLLKQLCNPQNRVQLYEAIKNNQYEIAPPHIILIPKDNGEYRKVFCNEGIDRIFLSIYNDILCELYRDRIHPACKSYQKGIGCGQTVIEISKRLGLYDGYKCDLSKYFDSVKLSIIEDALKELDTGSPLDQIVWDYYHNDLVFDENGNLIQRYGSLKQGCAVAAFLANYVLRDIDAELSNMNIIYVRYSDDLLLVGKDADKALARLEQMLIEKGLSLNPKKVEKIDKEHWFTFLGFNIKGEQITFSKKSVKKFQKEIQTRTLNKRKITARQATNVINHYLYKGYQNGEQSFGWGSYFLPIVNVEKDIIVLDEYLKDCIRACKTGKKKIGGLGSETRYSDHTITRGTGRNVKANIQKTEGILENYISMNALHKAIKISKPVYETLVRQL